MKTKINKNGYLIFDDEKGRLVHRWVAEKKYGKDKIQGKEIHHIDGIKTNNEKTNLLLIDKEDHYNLTKHENKNKLLLKVIIFLAILYILISWILMFFPITEVGKIIPVLTMRLSVYFILLLAIEIRFGFIAQHIRSSKREHFELN